MLIIMVEFPIVGGWLFLFVHNMGHPVSESHDLRKYSRLLRLGKCILNHRRDIIVRTRERAVCICVTVI